MKKITFIILFFTISLQAQNVQFADPLFKEALIDMGVDENGDNEIQVSEAEAETYLEFYNYTFHDVSGLEAFTNVTEIDFESVSGISSLVLSDMPKLEKLKIQSVYGLTELAFSNLPGLKDVEIGYCRITGDINFSVLTNLERLFIINVDNLKGIDCSNMPSLIFFDQRANRQLVDVDFTGTKNIETFKYINHGGSDNYHVDSSWTKLKEWQCSQYENAVFSLPPLPKLEKLTLGSIDQAEELDFTIYPTLKELRMTYMNNLWSMDIEDMPNLEFLHMYAMWDLREVNVINLPSLEEARLEFIARASDITLSQLPNLKLLKMVNMERVRNINVTDSKASTLEIQFAQNCENLVIENLDPELVWIDGLDKVKKIDLSSFKKMNYLRLWNCEELEEVNTKNGTVKGIFEVRQNYNVQYICCDDFDAARINAGLTIDDIENCEVDTVCESVSTENINSNIEKVKIFPTTTHDVVTIICEDPVSHIALIDASGRQLMLTSGFDNNQTSIDLSSYAPGMYYLQINIEDNIVVRKVVKL